MRGPALFVGIVVAMLLAAIGGIVYIVSHAAPPPRARTPVAPVEVSPAVVHLGAVSQCGDMIAVRSSLRNVGTEPFHINHVVAKCGCTVPDLRTPLRLDPGQRVEFTVTLDPWASTGPHTQQVDFIYAEATRGPSFRIDYEVISPIRTAPGAAHRQQDPSTVIKVTADDGKRFSIQSVDPPVADDWVRTPTSETHLTINWELVDDLAKSQPELFEFDEKGMWRRGKLSIVTDREGCPAVTLRLYNDQDFVAAGGATPGPLAPAPEAPDSAAVPAPPR